MDLRQLRHFAAVLDARSFSVAARDLAVTQPVCKGSGLAYEPDYGKSKAPRQARGVVFAASTGWL